MDQPSLFLKDISLFSVVLSPFLLLILILIIPACVSGPITTTSQAERRERTPENSPMVKGQVTPPDDIQSIQLYGNTEKNATPSIELGSNDFLTLRFDELGQNPRMFRVRVRHRNADWSDSGLMKDFYLSGYYEDLLSGGDPSGVQGPYYVHYHYRFPNEQMQVKMSGNYLMEILDYSTSRILFSLPFFVYENRGRMSLNLEEVYGLDSRYLLHHQPFARYQYPGFVVSPVTDLRLFFVQNRFWGRSREADVEDMSESGIYYSWLSRPSSFIGVYEFRPLDLRRFDDPRQDVKEILPETIPPRVRLFRDVVNLNVRPSIRMPSAHGHPRDDHKARYVDVRFELELPEQEETDASIYVYGPFNQWTINEKNRMEYQEETNSYIGRALIKEGAYDYKYAILEDGIIDDLRLDASFASTRQEYMSLIYFRDPQYQADRLLQIQIERTR